MVHNADDSARLFSMLTLSEALKAGRLQELVAQGEAQGVGGANKAKFDEAVRLLATAPHQKIEHRVPHLAVVRTKREFVEVHVPCVYRASLSKP
jgi:hypothetical protein